VAGLISSVPIAFVIKYSKSGWSYFFCSNSFFSAVRVHLSKRYILSVLLAHSQYLGISSTWVNTRSVTTFCAVSMRDVNPQIKNTNQLFFNTTKPIYILKVAMAIFILLTAATRTRIVPAYFLFRPDEGLWFLH